MKVFIAGATGVLGRASVPKLVAAGHDVLGVARAPDKVAQLREQGAVAVPLDLFDAPAVREAITGVDAIVHMATSIPPASKAWRSRAWTMHDRLRREGTKILAEAGRDGGVTRFVKESVCFGYTDHGSQWIDEEAPLVDAAFMAATLDGERTASGFAGDARTGVVLRFGLFYSDDARSLDESLAMANRGLGPMIGAADAYQPSIHVDDAATAIVAALSAPSGPYNVADEPITKGEWNEAFANAFGIDRRQHSLPKLVLAVGGQKLALLAASRRICSERFTETTGWVPRYRDATIGLEAVAEAWRSDRGAA
ncbi:MAG: NAD-dependent epimerase/dehydratase family protein [Acidimicrobiales bacterium]